MKTLHIRFPMSCLAKQVLQLKSHWDVIFCTTLAPGWFSGFSKQKNAWTHVALRRNISAPVRVTDLVAPSLSVCTRKKFFAWGLRFLCEWRHKWRTFRPPWPTLPGPGRKPLGGSISLKTLLDTRLQSESFDILDDLLGFRVQKLWSKLVKID